MQAYYGTVLIAEDDAALRHSLSDSLRSVGFTIAGVSSGEDALAELKQQPFDVVLLDLNMPGMGGMAACARIRALYPKLQIIVLTVRDSDEDKVSALDSGADDYVTKPFKLLELVARLRSAIRRAHAEKDAPWRVLAIGEITLEADQHRVSKRGVEIRLTPKEFDLLHLLMQHAGKPISHQRLLTAVWGEEYGNEREYLRTYVSQLRRKIEDDAAHPVYLTTENYIGYRFQQPSTD